MSKLTDFLVSERGKKITGLFYGFGASIVIIGALFKILHLPGAAEMLVAGMGTEAFLFALGSFEPPHKEWDWSLVFPVLAMGHGHDPHGESLPDAQSPIGVSGVTAAPAGASGGGSDLKALIDSGELSKEDVEKLSKAIKNLGKTADNIADLSNTEVATKSFVSALDNASSATNELATAQSQTSDALKGAMGNFESEMQKTSDSLAKALQEVQQESSNALKSASSTLVSSYEKISEKLTGDFDLLKDNTSAASKSLETVTSNLSSINSVYELQLKMIKEGSEVEQTRILKSKEINSSLEGLHHKVSEISSSIEGSIDDSRVFKENVSELKKKVSDLNGIYGNMLNALNS